MKGRRQLLPLILTLFSSLLWLAGCGHGGSIPDRPVATSDGQPNVAESADVDSLIGDYMPPLEGGSLEIAPPKNWNFSRAGSDYLVGFHPIGSTLNDLPRILVSVQPYDSVEDWQATNAQQLLQSIQETVASDQLKSPAAIITLGGRTWIEYVELAKNRGTLVARQVLQTVFDGRLYQVRLEAPDRDFPTQRAAGLAAAASAKFVPAAKATDPAEPELSADSTSAPVAAEANAPLAD
jgi:hypothetical protein